MALAIDGSTPAIATQTTGSVATVTTASFTPPSGSLLLIRYSANTIDPNDPGNPTITDSLGGHLTYTSWDIGKRPDSPLADGQVATWTAPVVSSAAMTVTVTNGAASPNRHAALSVTVLTGADATTPVGAHGKSSSLSAASIAQNYTASATNGWGFLVVCDWFDAGAETAGTGCTLEGSADLGGQFTYAFIRRTAADDSNGVTNTLRATVPGTSTSLRWAWIEILPAVVAAGGTAGPVLTPPAGQVRRFAGTAITLDHGTVVQAAGADVPSVYVQPSSGYRPARAGSTLILQPRAEPSPAQNQPVEAPVIVAGRPPSIGGQAWLTAPHADPPVSAPPVEAPITSAGRPGPTPGSAWTTAPRAEPATDQPPAVVPLTSSGRPGQASGSTWTSTPRAEPSPLQNQPIQAPAISAGRPAAAAATGWLTGARAEPAQTPDTSCPVPVVAGRLAAPAWGSAQLLTPRADPATTPDAPVPVPLITTGKPRPLAGTAFVAELVAQHAASLPTVTVAAGWRRTAAPAATLLGSTFTTPPPVAFIHPLLAGTGVRLAVIGSSWLQRPTELTGHFCPPPTPRPDLGTTTRPSTGTTLYDPAATGRPSTGVTPRPDTGVTTEC